MAEGAIGDRPVVRASDGTWGGTGGLLGWGHEGGTDTRSPFSGFRSVSKRPLRAVAHSLANGLAVSVHSQPGSRV